MPNAITIICVLLVCFFGPLKCELSFHKQGHNHLPFNFKTILTHITFKQFTGEYVQTL